MTRTELQKQFYEEKGIECVNSQGEPDIDYMQWLEDKVLESHKPVEVNYLERINDLMWNTWGVKSADFGRSQGEAIMEILNEWAIGGNDR